MGSPPFAWNSLFPTSASESHLSLWPLHSASHWEGYPHLSPHPQCLLDKFGYGEGGREWEDEAGAGELGRRQEGAVPGSLWRW